VNYYNDNDSTACAWLGQLIKDGLIPPGDVDNRSIADVEGQELKRYIQCHFFAGIGGWPYALQLANWPADRPVWTGSCPCQPFSIAGKGVGTDDERHLWPEFARLIGECKPPAVFGEQVASADVVGTELEASFVVAVQRGEYAKANKLAKRLIRNQSFHYGRRWIDGVRADLEAINYSFGFRVLGAHSAGAPHIRQRLFWVADAKHMPAGTGDAGEQGDAAQYGRRGFADGGAVDSGLGHTIDTGLQGHAGHVGDGHKPGRINAPADGPTRTTSWDNFDLLRCVEPTKEPGRYVEKRRRVESGTQPLAFRIPGRVGLLRGYGNAIVPQVAAEFIMATQEAMGAG